MIIDPNINRQDISKILGNSLSTIEKDIRILRKKGLIERLGSDKTGTWNIIAQE